MSVDQAAKREIPDATVARLPGYLRALGQLTAQDVQSVSSEELAHSAGVSSAKLRKDLSHLGSYGVRGVGYDVAHLTYQISRALGLTHDWPVIIVGMGNLGRALASYGGFATKGFKVVALLDRDEAIVGDSVDELAIQPMGALTSLVVPGEACIGVIATPAASAQAVADLLVAAGVSSILNFAATAIQVPEGVHMRKVDLSTELQILAFHEQQRVGGSDELLDEAAGR
ncbi:MULTISPECIES: redox-sensing transcriptional repressor Rex [Janibacter]|uniref:Redox-sensing transcriptional repressor Rex n=1 Tax=Janibacter indicus TaxID=857417 RepID=A0A1W2CPL4_9MICO|nr:MULTISPECIES: redox-sensing transcriptional repressor Rex [Janibacter]QNF93634.1 redox-sensing transcriptional repressor Rex [Janibacter sp. YB324]SMC87131.1 redox-sensing transcriptional repressor [Janibacter indicus]